MNIGKWFHQLFNPHCPDCIRERELERICNTCEILKEELANVNRSNQELLKQIIEPESERTVIVEREPVEIKKNIPWRVKQQMLEAEDRQKAILLRNAPKPESTESLEDTILGASLKVEK